MWPLWPVSAKKANSTQSTRNSSFRSYRRTKPSCERLKHSALKMWGTVSARFSSLSSKNCKSRDKTVWALVLQLLRQQHPQVWPYPTNNLTWPCTPMELILGKKLKRLISNNSTQIMWTMYPPWWPLWDLFQAWKTNLRQLKRQLDRFASKNKSRDRKKKKKLKQLWRRKQQPK